MAEVVGQKNQRSVCKIHGQIGVALHEDRQGPRLDCRKIPDQALPFVWQTLAVSWLLAVGSLAQRYGLDAPIYGVAALALFALLVFQAKRAQSA